MHFIHSVKTILQAPLLALDLGTANTRLYAEGVGVIAEIPTTLAFNEQTMSTITPLKSGVVFSTKATGLLLKPLLEKTKKIGFVRPRILVCAPADTSLRERKALVESISQAGGGQTTIIPEPLAAAVGARLNFSYQAQMLVDIGDGVTDIAVLLNGQIVRTVAVRVACSDLKKTVQDMLARKHRIWLNSAEVESLIQLTGHMHSSESEGNILSINGLILESREQKEVEISYQDILSVMTPVINRILSTIKRTLEKLPQDLCSQVYNSGIYLTGGGACIQGMSQLIKNSTYLNVEVVDAPLKSVIQGAIELLHSDEYQDAFWRGTYQFLDPSAKMALDI